jgi:hypothetical protein
MKPIMWIAVFLLSLRTGRAIRRAGARGSAGAAPEEGSLQRLSATRAAVERVQAGEVRFWSSEWEAIESDLQKLVSVVESKPDSEGGKRKALVPPHLNLNPKSSADLLPALGMLKALYEQGKERIAQLNAREKSSKKDFAEKEAQHKATLERIESRFHNHTLSAEFRANETRDETRMWNYWQKCRERQHRQYHTGLKIQHGTLERVKKMIDMYEKTLSGKTAEAKKELAKVAPPEIVFLQTRRAVVQFCEESLTELRSAREELLHAVPLTAGFA